MKANELMIGDWVMLFDNIPTRVDAIGDVEIYLTDDQEYGWHAEYPFIKPVPLTPEILEKNSDGGFFYHDSPIIGYNGKRSTHHIGRASLYVEWERISMKPYIEIHGLGDTFYKNYVGSVHELQHALRLCGIEKEITI